MLERERAEKEGLIAEFEETRKQLEEDVDREIEELKEKYEAKLATEREAALRLKGENGIMRKKFTALQKDIEDQKDDISSLVQNKKNLYEHIASLEKDIAGLKKEIRERDETIGDKEKRIYDLKKKNQELEKFKFVLDYKIKELKRQIEPRENEIADMRKQVEEMDMELEQYHKSNSALDLMIGELRLKMDGMQKEINLQRDIIAEGAAYISRFRRDLSATAAANLDKHKDLKLCVRELYKTYVLEEGAPKAAGGRVLLWWDFFSIAQKADSSIHMAVKGAQILAIPFYLAASDCLIALRGGDERRDRGLERVRQRVRA